MRPDNSPGVPLSHYVENHPEAGVRFTSGATLQFETVGQEDVQKFLERAAQAGHGMSKPARLSLSPSPRMMWRRSDAANLTRSQSGAFRLKRR